MIEQLTPRHEKAIAALLATATITEAAKQSGIGFRTLTRWLADPAFNEAYQTARKQAVKGAITCLQRKANEAADALAKIMADKKNTPASRVTAARTILDMSVRALILEDIEQRLTVVEEAYANKSRRR